MDAKKRKHSELQFAKWVKEGRGSGRGRDYKPWLTVRDVPSQGRSHRVFGHKAQRTHHLLSDLELAAFLLLEWHQETTDIREQFPLPLDVTLTLAEEAGIRHPAVSGVAQHMTTDFRVSTSDSSRPEFALQAKPYADLTNPRTIEKLELERRYWAAQEIPWYIITEKDIPGTVFQNINWLYPAQGDHIPTGELCERLTFYTHYFRDKPGNTLISIAKSLDAAYHMAPGESLLEIRQMLAHRLFLFDLRTPYSKLTAADLTLANPMTLSGGVHVSGE